MRWTVGTKIGVGFGSGLAILSGIGVVSYHGINQLTESAEWVAHTDQVLEEVDGLLLALIDAQNGQRGFIITAQDEYLGPYDTGIQDVDERLSTLKSLTADNSRQQHRLGVIEPVIRQRMELLRNGIDEVRSGGVEAGRAWTLTGKGMTQMELVRSEIAELRAEAIEELERRSADNRTAASQARQSILIGTFCAFVIFLLLGVFLTRSISGRMREMTSAAKKIAEGDLTRSELSIHSRDEVGELATAFETMRTNLKDMALQVRQATENVNSTAAEMLASTQQQATAAKEQAATIQEITATLEEVNQSGSQIGDRARQVSTLVEAGTGVTQRGMKATLETSQTMESIRNQVEEVAENVVSLSERTQTIGEIIATVSEIAEQSNLLALNASIEAVSAGDQGSRFSVVAHEMKSLADRAKDCTVQVRTILGEIQKGINTSVMLTEEAVKRADGGKQQAHATETTIREMTETNSASIQAFQQIVAGTNQQQLGVGQVTQGMQDIRQAITQVASGTSQLEKAAANMTALSQQLQRVVSQYRV